MMTTARTELPYPGQVSGCLLGEGSDGIASLGRICWYNVLAASGVLVICKLDTRNFVKQVSVEYIAQ